MIKAAGKYVIIKPEVKPAEVVTASGIVLTTPSDKVLAAEADYGSRRAIEYGEVVSIGPLAAEGCPPVGTRVAFRDYRLERFRVGEKLGQPDDPTEEPYGVLEVPDIIGEAPLP